MNAPINFNAETAIYRDCEIEVDDAACTVDDALKLLASAVESVTQAVLADPDIARDFFDRIVDQQERAEAIFTDARRRIVDRCDKHNEEQLKRALRWARSI